MEHSPWIPSSTLSNTFHRSLGDSEYAFFKSSGTGLGDMFLHISLSVPQDVMRRERVCIAWCIIRVTHPLLMSKVAIGYDDAVPRFWFTVPTTMQEATDDAERALHYRSSIKDDLIFDYMNGPRTLSNDYLSYLVISQQTSKEEKYDLLMCAPHFLGDGMSLHQSTHDLIVLLTSSKSDMDLLHDLQAQLERTHSQLPAILPGAFESRLSAPCSRLARAICKVNFLQTKQGEIGGHVFPRIQRGPRRTRLIEHPFNEEQTQAILSACKRNGVSVNNALFALCNIAWSRTCSNTNSKKLPMMMYSAINVRPYLAPVPICPSTYWFLALTYFTVVLPSFFPPCQGIFWHRARLAKSQTTKYVKSPFLASRALSMAAQRGGTRTSISTTIPESESYPQLPPDSRTTTPSPSHALLGLSLIGNLDHIYTPTSYAHPSVRLHSVTTASRQKEGGILLLEHTFAGRLWLHLCWDEMGFEEGVVETWWSEVVSGVGEFLK